MTLRSNSESQGEAVLGLKRLECMARVKVIRQGGMVGGERGHREGHAGGGCRTPGWEWRRLRAHWGQGGGREVSG